MSAKGDNASNQVTRSTTVREITIVSAWSNRAWSNSKSMSICNILMKMYTIRTKKRKQLPFLGYEDGEVGFSSILSGDAGDDGKDGGYEKNEGSKSAE